MSSGNPAVLFDMFKGLAVAAVGVGVMHRLCPARVEWAIEHLADFNMRLGQLHLQKAKAKAAAAAKATHSNEKKAA